MKKVAVFGNAGGGKSALAQRLAALTGLPLYVVDMMRFRPGGAKVPHDEFSPAHADILRRDEWIIDGFGNTAIAWERLAATVTLIHVDLPLFIHFRWITKRLIKGLFADPARLARKQSAMEQLRLCHLHLTPEYRQLVTGEAYIEEGAQLEITWPNLLFPQRGEEGAFEPVRALSLAAEE
jgi:hypothetical protein